MMKRTILRAVIFVAAIAGGTYWFSLNRGKEEPPYDMSEARVDEVKALMKLCTMEIHDEMAIRDSVNGKWIFARERVNGYIGFDLESMTHEMKGDTLVVYFPPEEFKVYEDVGPESYKVLDTWSDRPFYRSGTLTAAEENIIKQRRADSFRAMAYRKGYVTRARRNAVSTLATLVSHFSRPVVVVDTVPDGVAVDHALTHDRQYKRKK